MPLAIAISCLLFAALMKPLHLPNYFNLRDAFYHFAGFFVLTVTLRMAAGRRYFKRIAALTIGFGALLEIVQSYTPYRSASLSDWYADAVGVIAAWLICWVLSKAIDEWRKH